MGWVGTYIYIYIYGMNEGCAGWGMDGWRGSIGVREGRGGRFWDGCLGKGREGGSWGWISVCVCFKGNRGGFMYIGRGFRHLRKPVAGVFSGEGWKSRWEGGVFRMEYGMWEGGDGVQRVAVVGMCHSMYTAVNYVCMQEKDVYPPPSPGAFFTTYSFYHIYTYIRPRHCHRHHHHS